MIDDRLGISLSTALEGKLKYFWEFLLSPDDHALAGTIVIFSTAFSFSYYFIALCRTVMVGKILSVTNLYE